MEQGGKLHVVLQETSGDGKKGKWAKCDFVLDVEEGKYPKKMVFTAWNDAVDVVKSTPIGSHMKVSFDLSAREYNGKWYSDVKAWKVEVVNRAQESSRQTSQNDNASQGSQGRYVSESDLPF